MAKVLVVDFNRLGFHPKLTAVTLEAFRKRHFHVSYCDAQNVCGGWTYATLAVNHVHFVRIPDYETAEKVLHFLPEGISFSFTMLGFAERTIGGPMLKLAKKALSVYIFSINPHDLKEHIEANKRWKNVAVRVFDEPPYPGETKEFYREISQTEAREKLKIPHEWKIGLYFGTYWYSKGADLLLEETQKLTNPNLKIFFVGDTKLSSLDVPVKKIPRNKKCCVFVDRYVSEEEARDYFRAADFIVLPYRKLYEWDTSGIFTKAMLAERPVLVPYFQPFSGLLKKYDVGEWIPPHLYSSLAIQFSSFLDWTINHIFNHIPWEFDKYLDAQKGWGVLGYHESNYYQPDRHAKGE